ncbi:MAG: glycosyltransferase, partial [Ferruginibacter sp.]
MYYTVGWNSISEFFLPAGSPVHLPFISVIIPARNEERNLPVLLESLYAQTYSKDCFEVILVDDFSEDNSAGIVSSFPMDNLQLVKLKDH